MTPSAALELAALAAVVIPILALGHPRTLGAARSWTASGPRAAALVMVLAAPAAVALPWERPVQSAARAGWLALYAALPLAALLVSRRSPREVNGWDWVAVALYWVPFQMSGMESWWRSAGDPFQVPWMKVTAAGLALVSFAAVRRLDGVGHRLRIGGTDAVTAAAAAGLFLAVAVPAALLSGLAEWDPRPGGVGRILAVIGGIALLTALPEEILFRGILFNLLQRRLRGRAGPWPALVISAMAFAAAHAGRGAGADPRYLALVTLAGIAYGWCYLRTGSLVPAVAAHTAVNAAHQILFATAAAPP